MCGLGDARVFFVGQCREPPFGTSLAEPCLEQELKDCVPQASVRRQTGRVTGEPLMQVIAVDVRFCSLALMFPRSSAQAERGVEDML